MTRRNADKTAPPRRDPLSPEERSRLMAKVRSTDTGPEMAVRRAVHGLGYRYGLHGAGLPGKPDLVFRSRRKVIFVHGCFWHRHAGCPRNRTPSARREFWENKLEGNRRRDAANIRKLRAGGWGVMVVWECRAGDRPVLERRIRRFLGERP